MNNLNLNRLLGEEYSVDRLKEYLWGTYCIKMEYKTGNCVSFLGGCDNLHDSYVLNQSNNYEEGYLFLREGYSSKRIYDLLIEDIERNIE